MIMHLFFCSCGEIKTQIASEEIVGKYSGKATFLYKHSIQNIGLDDEKKESSGTISIFKKETGEVYIISGDGNIQLSGITFASNGATFSIPHQFVKQKNGSRKEIEGYPCATLEGVKYDGIYLSDEKYLLFGYQKLVKYDYWGQKADVLVYCEYKFNKISD